MAICLASGQYGVLHTRTNQFKNQRRQTTIPHLRYMQDTILRFRQRYKSLKDLRHLYMEEIQTWTQNSAMRHTPTQTKRTKPSHAHKLEDRLTKKLNQTEACSTGSGQTVLQATS